MSWHVELTYTDGTTESMYCDTRETARERARFYRNQWLFGGSLGKALSSVRVVKA